MDVIDPRTDPYAKVRYAGLHNAAAQAEVAHWGPYSKFKVLAAVESVDGRFYGGSNVENANLTLTVHAEHAAVLAGLADGVLERVGREWVKTVYVACAFAGGPCGSCRQVLAEFAAPDATWIGENTATGEVQTATLDELMPAGFGPADLGV